MDDLFKELLSELECPVCYEYIRPPITMCENGHNLCSNCKLKLESCPCCKGLFTNVRNITVENLTRKVKYPCKYREYGCRESFHLDHVTHHESKCPHRVSVCPFVHIYPKCQWEGAISEIRNHVKDNHSGHVSEVSEMRKIRLKDVEKNNMWMQAVLNTNEMFFSLCKLTDSFLYHCVLYVGPEAKACQYKYKVTFNTADGSGSLCASYVCYGHQNNVEEIFQNGNCAIFPREFMNKCVIRKDIAGIEEIINLASM